MRKARPLGANIMPANPSRPSCSPAWGSKVPVSAGGLLEKPHWEGEEPPTLVKPLNDFQLFIKVHSVVGMRIGLQPCGTGMDECLEGAEELVQHLDPQHCTAPQEKRLDILAVNSHLMVEPDQPAFMASAAVFWKERLSEEERQAYQIRARGV